MLPKPDRCGRGVWHFLVGNRAVAAILCLLDQTETDAATDQDNNVGNPRCQHIVVGLDQTRSNRVTETGGRVLP